ncbi:acyl dehydratase [Vibrio ishigakensis]|uniref:Acyl dehydratase n=1 Tax=Vibrio ishigakensis TaxID=1481914 RepID=A0A0B8NVV8_9VIBR|nr:MaoC family dehydratase [Vibrio ishigakensis]GAM55248.1 acyl dehydratase [Vibrio ishigakensis]
MKVVDILKHKGESLSRHHSEFLDRMSPSLKDYWSELVSRAHAQHLFKSWGKEFTKPAVNEEVENPVRDTIEMKPEAEALYNEMSTQIGEETYVGEWFSIDQQRIDAFAKVTDDMQWIHTDPERAKEESPFKSTIAHGFLTLALLPKLTEAVDPDKPQFPTAKVTVNLGLNSVRFPYPVKVGANIRAKSKLIKVTPIQKGLEITREVKVEIEGVRRPGCIAESVIRLYF